MRKNVLIALGAAAAVMAIVLAVSQLAGGSTGGSPEAPAAAPVPGLSGQDVLGQADQGARIPAAVPYSPGTVQGFSAADQTQAGAPAGGPSVAGGGSGEPGLPLPQVSDRKIVRNASLTLGVEDVGKGVQEVENIAGAAGGFVSASSVSGEVGGESAKKQTATVTVKVPAGSYVSVMGQLRGIAKERQSESSETSDVTEEFTDLQARQRNLETTEARYLELLGKASTIPDILTLQDRINSVRLEVERIQGRINLLNNLSDLATITVQLRPFVPAQEEPGQPGWAREAWENAWDASKDTLEALGTVAIVAGVVLAWLAVPALAIAMGWRLLGPRREGKGQA